MSSVILTHTINNHALYFSKRYIQPLGNRCGNIKYVPFKQHSRGADYIPRFSEEAEEPLDAPDPGSIYYIQPPVAEKLLNVPFEGSNAISTGEKDRAEWEEAFAIPRNDENMIAQEEVFKKIILVAFFMALIFVVWRRLRLSKSLANKIAEQVDLVSHPTAMDKYYAVSKTV